MNLMDLFIKIGVDDQATSKISKISSSVGNGLKSAAKVGATALKAVGTASIAVAGSLVATAESTREYRTEMGKLDAAFAANGLSAETATGAYKELFSIIGETDQSVEAAQQISLLANAEEDVAKWADLAAGVVGQFGDALQPETFYEAANETLKLGEATGAYTQMLEGTGRSVDEFNAGLAACTTEAEKQAYMLAVTEEALGAAGDRYKETNAAVIDANKASEALTASLAKIGGAIEPLITSVKMLGATLLSDLAPMVETVSKAFQEGAPQGVEAFGNMLGNIVTKITEYAPKVAEMGVSLISSLVKGISSNIGTIAQGAVSIITELSTGILNMLPQIIELGLNLITSLAMGIAESLPELIPTIVDVILKIVETLTSPEMITNLINAGIELILGLVNGLIKAIPKIIEAIPTIITNLITAILNNIPLIIEAGIKLIISLVANLPKIIVEIVKAVPKIIVGLVEAIASYQSKLAETGLNLIKGLWNGIKDAGAWLWDKISGFFGGIVDGIKNFFGIKSPSRLFRDEIGKMLAQGIGVGFDDEFAGVKRDIEKELDFGEANVGVSVSKVGGISNTLRSAVSQLNASLDQNATILVQSVLDGKVIGETAYQYSRNKMRAYGG